MVDLKAPIRIIPQGEIATHTGEPPALVLPDPGSFFFDRSMRFGALAALGHADAPYLSLMERLAKAQHAALDALPVPPAVDTATLALCHRHGLPPLAKDMAREPAWREGLAVIIDRMMDACPRPAQAALRDLQGAPVSQLEAMADRVLAFDYPALDPVIVPFLGAALQVYWLRRVSACGTPAFRKLDIASICPACGSPPVASVLRIDGPVPGARYLSCALCGTDWHFPRGQCTQCEALGKLVYYHLDRTGADARTDARPATGATVKAEACEGCRGYLKIINREREPLADAMADDLASLALDVLMDESGFERVSPNLLFVPGQR